MEWVSLPRNVDGLKYSKAAVMIDETVIKVAEEEARKDTLKRRSQGDRGGTSGEVHGHENSPQDLVTRRMYLDEVNKGHVEFNLVINCDG